MALHNKTALIYGVTTTLGRDLVQHLRKMGANLVFSAPDTEETRKLVSSLQSECIVLFKEREGDGHWQTQSELITLAVQKYQSIDFVFSTGGLFGIKESSLLDDGMNLMESVVVTDARALEFHVASVITLTRLAIRQFLKQGGSGCIIHTCPLSGACGSIFDPLFFAAKSAIIGIIKSYASLLEATDIRINCIVPDIQDMSNTVFFQSEATTLVCGHLDNFPTDQCIKAYSSIVEDTTLNGGTVVVNRVQHRVETSTQENPLYKKLHNMSQSRKNGFLEKVKHQILENKR